MAETERQREVKRKEKDREGERERENLKWIKTKLITLLQKTTYYISLHSK